MNLRWGFVAALGLASLFWHTPAVAQSYPARAVRIVVPFPPGSTADSSARLLGDKFRQLWDTPIIVDNRAGASGITGAELVNKSQADGYTLLFTTSALTLSAALYSKLPFDSQKDFVPIGGVSIAPFVLVVHPAVPAKSVQELIDLAKAKPGALSGAYSGVGAADHACGELFKTMTRLQFLSVPYRGMGPSIVSVVGGEVNYLFATVNVALPLMESGKVRALGVTTAKRFPGLPNVPTVGESLPGFECSNWQALFAPRDTPPAVVQKLEAGLATLLKDAETMKRFREQGLVPYPDDAGPFGKFLSDDAARWARVLKQANIRAE